jgi:hypothetical protein
VSGIKATLSMLFLAASLTLGFAAAKADYVVHEWGTFTSLQGADGEQRQWRPRLGADLPSFVYLDNRLNSIGGGYHHQTMLKKSLRFALQRMETPVLYFYADQEMEVDVEVKFPQGSITEWYPRVSHAGPAMRAKSVSPTRTRESFVRWDNVRILPQDSERASLYLDDGKPSHYYPARATESNPLSITTGSGTNELTETEKLLFYRGLGNFTAPLKVSLSGDETKLYLANNSSHKLGDMFVLVVRHGQAKVTRVAGLAAKGQAAVDWKPGNSLQPLESVATKLGEEFAALLVEQGLYPAEAKAMVRTWRGSWFEEDGVRVLYTLSGKWTDDTLPLELTPTPRELVRVMVGRAEFITPKMEWDVLQEIVRFADESTQAAAVKGVRELRLGRFLEPVIARHLGANPTKTFRIAGQGLQVASEARQTLSQTAGNTPGAFVFRQ